jgi:hypothetical protein
MGTTAIATKNTWICEYKIWIIFDLKTLINRTSNCLKNIPVTNFQCVNNKRVIKINF